MIPTAYSSSIVQQASCNLTSRKPREFNQDYCTCDCQEPMSFDIFHCSHEESADHSEISGRDDTSILRTDFFQGAKGLIYD